MTPLIVAALLGASLLGAQPSRADGSLPHPVSYQLAQQTDYRQRLSVSRTAGQLPAQELRPQVVQRKTRFEYHYRLFDDTPLQVLPLDLHYQDGRQGSDRLGLGWRLVLKQQWQSKVAIDLLSPTLRLKTDDQTTGVIMIAGNRLPVRKRPANHKLIGLHGIVWESQKSYHGQRYTFMQYDSDSVVRPYSIDSDKGEQIVFNYQLHNGHWKLNQIQTSGGEVRFTSAPQTIRLVQIEMNLGNHKQSWQLHYLKSLGQRSLWLNRITINGRGTTDELSFSYSTGQTSAKSKKVDWCDPSLPKSSVWLKLSKEQHGGRWSLPQIDGVQGNVRFHPGLRFMDLDLDGELDLVNTQEGQLSSWLWDDAGSQWRDFSHTYKPKQVSVLRSKRPSGSHYINLPKVYENHNHTTNGHQSILTSVVQPSLENHGQTLDFRRMICFPPVLNGKLDGSRDWDCEPFTTVAGKFPPLQYHDAAQIGVWPKHLQGIQGVESYFNQGSQLVRLTRDGKLNLLYIGLRYVDIGVNPPKVLLTKAGQVGFRDSKNCRVWKNQIPWENNGKRRKVRVDLCQAFWVAESTEWNEGKIKKGKFWRRLDLENGRAGTNYILPWQDNDPELYSRYHTFRGVDFAQLESEQTFVVIKGPDSLNDPAHRLIYHLQQPERGEWVNIKPDNPLYFPEIAWRSQKLLYQNIGGGWADDLILKSGKALINMEQAAGPRWRHCPAFDLPIHCNPFNGGCLIMDLDEDDQEYQDLLVGTGATIYINQAEMNFPGYVMAEFTDENGIIQKVTR